MVLKYNTVFDDSAKKKIIKKIYIFRSLFNCRCGRANGGALLPEVNPLEEGKKANIPNSGVTEFQRHLQMNITLKYRPQKDVSSYSYDVLSVILPRKCSSSCKFTNVIVLRLTQERRDSPL